MRKSFSCQVALEGMGFLLDFLHARKVSQLNLRFKFAQFPRYPESVSLIPYGNPPNPQRRVLILIHKQAGCGLAKADHSPHQRGWDSNPRWNCSHTTFPRLHLKPLGHPSLRFTALLYPRPSAL